MKTTLDVPKYLIEEVKKETKAKTKTEALIVVMKEFLRQRYIKEIQDIVGKVEFDASAREIREGNERIK